MTSLTIPAQYIPADGRFGCGPSKVRPEAAQYLASPEGQAILGTSHRKPPVKGVVHDIRQGIHDYFGLPEDYVVALGNGGATSFWDAACYSLINERSAHAVFGEFSSKFAQSAQIAPHLADPVVVESPVGTHPTIDHLAGAADEAGDVDVYALTHNETSTGVTMAIQRPNANGLVLVDGTSAAGAVMFNPQEVDAYYFSPQKAFGADGGLWIALLSPAAQERIAQVKASKRPVPPSLSLAIALDNSTKDQTYNTPAIASLLLIQHNIRWMNTTGFEQVAQANMAKTAAVYAWAEASELATPFVQNPAERSPVVATIDLDDRIQADDVIKVLRANGIYDTDAYRKLGRNQLRIGLWPATDLEDVHKLVGALDFVLEALA